MRNIYSETNKQNFCKAHKFFLCCVLMLMTLFSCVIFSACGDIYKDLKINIYSADGEIMEVLNLVIDPSKESSSQRIGIEFAGIEPEDIGQVKVYSEPYELITDTHYTYNGNMCYVDVNPVMQSSGNAKLIVSHLASQKTKEIPITVKKKSEDVKITNSKYIISIPNDGEVDNNHVIDFSSLVRMMPDNMLPGVGTDNVYFKVMNNVLPSGVEALTALHGEFGEIYSGFKVSSSTAESTDDTCVKIYPVTFLNGEIENEDKYVDKVISIYFKKTLNDANVQLVQKDEVLVDLNNLMLLANDEELNTFKLTLKYGAEQVRLIETKFFEMYRLEVVSHDNQKISAFVDSVYDIVLVANVHTEDLIKVDIKLVPINYVGDFTPIVKSVRVKGELKADEIKVKKNGVEVDVSAPINIFDYYEEGNALGALFTFKPETFSGIDVHQYLNKMQIVISPDILCEANCVENIDDLLNNYGIYVNSKLYVLAIHLFNEPLEFYYNENLNKMVSVPFTQSDRIYVKYIQGNGTEESSKFEFKVSTINNSQEHELLENWKNVKATTIDMNFNRLEGVKSLTYKVGNYEVSQGMFGNSFVHGTNSSVVYLDRLNALNAETDVVYYLQVTDALGVDNTKVSFADFDVEVVANFEAVNSLKLHDGLTTDGSKGTKMVTYSYTIDYVQAEHNVLVFVFDNNTDIGEYTITLYQEGIKRASLTCYIYEDLKYFNRDYLDIQGDKFFGNNEEYEKLYPEADYIMASGSMGKIELNVPKAVLDSNIVKGYQFYFRVGYSDGNAFITDLEDEENYFEIEQVGTSNKAKFKAVKGTFVENRPYYVILVGSVQTKKFVTVPGSTSNSIVEEDVNYNNWGVLTEIFVYEEITKEDISINYSNNTMYVDNYLGVYYKDKAVANLEINMDEDLWNYTTSQYGNNVADAAKIRWVVDGTEKEEFKDLKKITLSFAGNSEYTQVVRAYVEQFDNIFELQCVFDVRKPILSERLRIKSELNLDADENYYINLKNGESYTVLAENFSSLGDVTHAETIIQVFDENGSAYTASDYFDVDQANNKITVKKVDRVHTFKLVVFAKDALKHIPSSDKSGYNNPISFLMNFDGVEEGLCDNAYFVMDIVLSDGSEENPYLIKSAKDFWEMDDTEQLRKEDTYWMLMTNITLDNVVDAEKIVGFNGNIKTFNDVVFTIDGVALNNSNKNLFVNFGGNISNIKFVVDYNYELINTDNAAEYLGLFDVNNGTLTDVGVVLNGNAKFNLDNRTTCYFGGLGGQNFGKIIYTKIEGVRGKISLEGSSKAHFGGLVGINQGSIVGCEKTEVGGEDDVVLNTSEGRSNAMSLIEIISKLTNSESSIGGVVGFNKNATISNAFVQATITAEDTSNVGGVIGINDGNSNSINVYFDDYIKSVDNLLTEDWKTMAIYNVKSASTIKAKDNAGGIVGLDTNGIYIECDYQILSVDNKEVAIQAQNRVGGIAGYSNSGKFAYCSVMSYCWNYTELKTEYTKVVSSVADLEATDYVGGIVGYAVSSNSNINNGNNEINDKVIVVYSSVNAYLNTTKEQEDELIGNVGGILSSVDNGSSIIFNAYFIGKLEGKVNYDMPVTNVGGVDEKIHYLALDNNGMAIYNVVYSLNIEEFGIKPGQIADGNVFDITNDEIDNGGWNPNRDFWWGNVNINGGYVFITTDTTGENRLPIFDLAPDSIEVTVKAPKAEGLEKVLMLDYFDFSQNGTLTDAYLSVLDSKWNKQSQLKDWLSFTVVPSGIGTVVLNVKSTNSNIVDITYDGRLLINGVGECELIFNSILNKKAEARIKVVVDYPIGDTLHISTSKTDLNKVVNGKTLSVAKDTSKYMYIITSGSKNHDFNLDSIDEIYSYKTKTNLNLKIKLKAPGSENVADYVKISGKSGDSIDLDNKTPFIISVLKKLQEGTFNVTVTPYIKVNGVDVEFKEVNFNLSTLAGATNITFSYDDAIVYPNDTVYLSAQVVTDDKFTEENIDAIYNYINIVSNNKFTFIKDFYDQRIYHIKDSKGIEIGSFKLCVNDYSEYENDVQIIRFIIEFSDMSLAEEATLQINAIIAEDLMDKVVYTIIPQRINKIEIKNYHKNSEGDWVLDNILKPNNAGQLIVDIAPDNGYYSYLEISDITGNEEILFIQTDEHGNALSLNYDPSSDKKGIKLYHYDGQEKSRIYILTQIDKRYSSKIHTIEIRAYSNNGSLLHSQTKQIDVKMLPEIILDYVLPNGYSIGGKIDADSTHLDLFLANGVDANFLIETRNSNSELEYVLTGYKRDGSEYVALSNKYEFVNIVGNHYVLRTKDNKVPNNDDVGCKIKIVLRAYAYLDNGDFEVTECEVVFTIVRFVVHGISVNNSIDNSDTTEIYGYIGKPVDLDFYFDKDDISFYDESSEGEKFWDTVYEYRDGIEDEYTDGSVLKEIYSILKALNNDDNNDYLILNDKELYKEADNLHYYNNINSDEITLESNNITVEEGYNVDKEKYLAVEFRLNGNIADQSWKIDTYETNPSDLSYTVVKNYHLNFKHATSWYEPTVVHNEDDFRKMTSGGRYILANDLVLKNYTPIDANLVEFDGNGRTITIQGFGSFNDAEIQAGLFRQIYEGMIVKNVVLKYESISDNNNMTFGFVDKNGTVTHTNLCNNPNVNYTSLNFGGIAAVNNGIITNCSVQGVIAINASTIEDKKFASGANYGINFFVGGMVAENSATGYITNSTSELSIYAQANIGGFVYSNEGKIVSCGVEKNTTIYSYNNNLEKTIVINIAGFAVENKNHISMSYVKLAGLPFVCTYKDEVNEILTQVEIQHGGTISAKDTSAGFVYSNSGMVEDSYVSIAKTGINNNTFSGFVYTNSGSITRAYSYINGGTKVDNNDTMFAPAGSKDLVDCIEFIVPKNGYNNGIEQGLKTLDVALRYDKTTYQEYGFAFGDNESAVWKINSGEMPILVIEEEKVVFKGGDAYQGLMPLVKYTELDKESGEEKISYKPNFAYYGTKENPYIITDLKSWEEYFENNSIAYYRIVKDINFATLGDNPITSKMSFNGNIQGNNMKLENVMLYSTSSLNSLGLFKDLTGVSDSKINNAVRNLTITTTSVWASRTNSVGLLAGLVENFNLYNINIDSQGVIIVGGNAVGGVAGIVRGEFDIDQITSNVGANSTRASTQYNYSIYMSKNNKRDVSENLKNVYYAGSAFGVLDGYSRSNFVVNQARKLSDKYFTVRNVYVSDSVSIIGDSVGAAFGFVGERVMVDNVDVNISGMLAGMQYSAGVAGENRGVITNADVHIADESFVYSTNVSSGVVGLNLGGLVKDSYVQTKIHKSGYGNIVGGIVGRNIQGTVNNVLFDGELNAYFTGGIVGVSYTDDMLINATTGAGTISAECKVNNSMLIPQSMVEYKDGNDVIKNYENVAITEQTMKYFLKSLTDFYAYQTPKEGEDADLSTMTKKIKVLGLIVGLSYEEKEIKEHVVDINDDGSYNIYKDDVEKTFVFNSTKGTSCVLVANEEIVLKDEVDDALDLKVEMKNFVKLTMSEGGNYVAYLVGANVTSFDSWYNSYSGQYIVVQPPQEKD